MSDQNIFQRAWGALADFFEWVVEVLGSDASRQAILMDLGIQTEQAPPLSLPADRIAGIKAYREAQNVDLDAFASTVNDFVVLLETIDAWVAIDPEGAAENARENTYRALLLLGTDYFRLRVPVAYFLAQLTRLFIDRPDQVKEIFAGFKTGEDNTADISAQTLLPAALFLAYWNEIIGHTSARVTHSLPKSKVLYGWDIAESTPTPVADELSKRMLSFEFEGKKKSEGSGAGAEGEGGPPAPGPSSGPATLTGKLGATAVWVPAAHGGPGLFIALHGSGEIALALGKEWQAKMKFASTGALDVIFREEGLDVHGPEDASATFTIEGTRKAEEVGPYVLGSTFGSRMEFSKPTITFEGTPDDVSIKVVSKKSAIVLKRDEMDSFVKGAVPSSGVRLEFDLGLGWSVKKELFLEGGSGLTISLPLNESLGPIRLRQVHVTVGGASAKEAKLEVLLTLDFTARGVTFTIDRIGYQLDATSLLGIRDLLGGEEPAEPEPEPEPGEEQEEIRGLEALASGFRGPSGIGVVVDTKCAKGGGYLFWDHAARQYAGAGQIAFRSWTLQAFFLITDKLPDGTGEASFLVIIDATIPPVQLPLGLRWTGVGGIIAANRSADIAALQAGLKNGALDSILFPANPVADAARTLTVVQTVMPARAGQFMVGLFFRFNWCVPTIGTIELGIILEFDDPWRLILLGQLRIALPNESKILILLQMDFLGVIDWERNEISFDAVLRDSRIKGLTLTGDAAYRNRWSGEDRYVLLAAGGFHPAFAAPESFPKLNRVAVEWTKGDSVRLRLEGYAAISPNTRQFGGRIEVLVRAAGFSVEAYLGVDVLLQLFPPGFVVHVQIGATVKWHGRTLFGVDVDFRWSAFNPNHVDGHATFKIWRFSKTIPFSRDLDTSEVIQPLPAIDPLPDLIAAVSQPQSWGGELSPLNSAVLTLREVPGSTDVLIHPLGELSVRQMVVPLAIDIDIYNNGIPPGDRRFDVTLHTANGDLVEEVAPVLDFFAPAQFLEMSDSEKLRAPSFERMEAGIRMDGAITFGGELDPSLIGDAAVEHETVPPEGTELPPEPGEPTPGRVITPFEVTLEELQGLLAVESYRPPVNRISEGAFSSPRLAVRTSQPRYVIARKSDLEAVPLADVPAAGARSYAAATQAMRRHRRENPADREELQVISVLVPERIDR